jgi:LPXTG-motif cell wall-anchored protein
VLRKVTLVLMGTLLTLVLVPSVAGAQEYPPSGGTLGVDASTVAAGGSLTISGDGCASSATVTFAVAGAAAGSTTADSAGAFSGSVAIPSSASGDVEVTASCAGPKGESVVLTATVAVTAAGSGSTLPRTGSSSSFPTVAVALVLLCVGAAFVVATRRRRALARTDSK